MYLVNGYSVIKVHTHSSKQLLIEDCTEDEAASIIPIFNSVLSVLRERNVTQIK